MQRARHELTRPLVGSRNAATSGGPISLLIGPPGAGKTMLARRLAPLLPSQTRTEAIHHRDLDTRYQASFGGSLKCQLMPTLSSRFKLPYRGVAAPGLRCHSHAWDLH
ncbi:MAG: ATP-binding protein [Thermoanaerobaculia bacterium]